MIWGLDDLLVSISRLFAPGTCFFCRAPVATDQNWCDDCDRDIKRIKSPYCPRCGLPLPGERENHLCRECLVDKPIFNLGRSLLVYEKKSRDLVQAVKYRHQGVILRQLLNKYPCDPVSDLGEADLIIPVPLHSSRLRQRGYNQSLIISRIVFNSRKTRIDPYTLVRKRRTMSQTGMNGIERRRNLKGAFMVKKTEKIAGKKIILVDDVFTTGTTVNECARALYKGGAAMVNVFTLARVYKRTP